MDDTYQKKKIKTDYRLHGTDFKIGKLGMSTLEFQIFIKSLS